jgi:hypothetical protein
MGYGTASRCKNDSFGYPSQRVAIGLLGGEIIVYIAHLTGKETKVKNMIEMHTGRVYRRHMNKRKSRFLAGNNHKIYKN